MEDNTEYRLTVKGLIGNDLYYITKKHMEMIRENAIILENGELCWGKVELTEANKK